MSDYQQNEVSKVVWPWILPEAKQSHTPSKIMPVIGFLIASSISAFLHFKQHHNVMPAIIMSIATVILICGLFIPPAHKKIHAGLQVFAFWVGTALSYILLVPFYYLVFPFARLCQKITGKDPMKRSFQADRETYWEDRPPVTDKAYYTRQG